MRMTRMRKSTKIAVAFLIYISVTAAYLLPRNTEIDRTEKYLTITGAYIVVLLLWWVLRKKEQIRERYEKNRLK